MRMKLYVKMRSLLVVAFFLDLRESSGRSSLENALTIVTTVSSSFFALLLYHIHKNISCTVQVPLGRGSTVAIITPFDGTTGKIDFPALQGLLKYHLQSGTTNLCILGTTGENAVLSMTEREQVLNCAVDLVKGRMHIMAGTGTIDPNHVRELTLQAADLGCDSALIVTPYYVKPPQAGLIQHMISAADIPGGLPVVVYNVPGRTAVNMSDESIAVCAQHDNIIAVKDATGDLTRVGNLKRLLAEANVKDFLLFSGDDETTLDFLTLPLERGGGGDGCISVTANVAAKEMATMVQLGLQGKKDEAQVINERLMGLHNNLFCESSPMPAKWAAHRLGLINSAYCRPPLLQLTNKDSQDKVEAALRLAGLL
jgi:4-hydroxy-tetrahydrodipicolinate synthase